MEFDVLLPTVVFIVVVIAVFSHQKFKNKISTLFEDQKFGTRDAVSMVLAMGLMVTVIAFAPTQAIRILFVAAYSYTLLIFTYIALEKWYIAIIPPAVFILGYCLIILNLFTVVLSLIILNLFAAVFAIIVIVYLGTLFSWKTTLIFAVLLTIMDIIQVFGTGFMVESAGKMLDLRLPAAVILPTYPTVGMIGLGLGDIFLSGLLAVQTSLKHGQKAGILTAATIGIAMFVYEAISLNIMLFEYFPATVVVISGWITSMGITRFIHLGS